MNIRNNTIQYSFCFAILLIAFTEANAQDFERYIPRDFNTPNDSRFIPQADKQEATGSDKVLVDRLDSVKILDSKSKVMANDANADANGVAFDFDDKTSLVFSDQFNQIVNQYIGQPISLRRLNLLSREIIQFYRNSDQPVVDVQIPEQKITGGTVQIIIIESRIGDVVMEGGPYFNPDITKRWIGSTYSGSKVYESSLSDDLFWLNQNSFRLVDVDLRPGTAEGTTDVYFRSHEVLPWRTYLGYEDSGVRSLDLERIYGGIVWGNAFGRDGTLSYQYTSNAEFDKLHAHAVSYQKAFNRRWSVQSGASWAGFAPDILGPLAQDGESWQVTSRLFRTIEKNRFVDRNISVGFDFKSTNNNLEFGGINVLATGAELVNLRFGLKSLTRNEIGEYFLITNDLFVGPGSGFSSGHNTAAFNSIRPGTSTDYVYNRTKTESRFDMGDMQLVVRNVAQYAFDRVLFSETLGFGGYDSIRGYDQRVFSGDSGWITNIEFGLRPIQLGSDDDAGALTVYSFFDAGKAYTRDPLPGEVDDLFLMSTGLGMRLSMNQNSSLRVDFGHGLEKAPGIQTRDRLHVGYVQQFGPRPTKN